MPGDTTKLTTGALQHVRWNVFEDLRAKYDVECVVVKLKRGHITGNWFDPRPSDCGHLEIQGNNAIEALRKKPGKISVARADVQSELAALRN